jgi:hypothetical protein
VLWLFSSSAFISDVSFLRFRRHRSVSRLALVGFWLLGRRVSEEEGGTSEGTVLRVGDKEWGVWGHGAFSRNSTYLPTLTNKIYVYPRT